MERMNGGVIGRRGRNALDSNDGKGECHQRSGQQAAAKR
jgi:hypothetical protein